ncbi:MAG: 1-deoxy-D-xylulose-5-phosphate reductoisomerase [Clostridia bacterium]|nr:1-deoxy-D-xylulose-5-phosphate reductoisomerase [Clostridia bacterium]
MIDKIITVLGSTGSVGTQTLDVVSMTGTRVFGISANSSVNTLEQQIRRFDPVYCAVSDEKAARELKTRVADTSVKIIAGDDASSELASLDGCDMVFNSLSGFAGLSPTLAAIDAKKDVALSNKETIVTAGEIVMPRAAEKGVKIIPVDSEHSAIFQCLNGKRADKLILTASGGPFFGQKRDELKKVTAADALRHPTWKMGKKITVDCATLMNKGMEVIEAARLFDMPADKIEVVVHRESIIHSMVEFSDSAVIAQLSVPDMRLCVAYALSYPERAEVPLKRLDFSTLSKLTFAKPDTESFSLLALAYYALEQGGVCPTVMNAANEIAVDAFLHDRIGFTDIFDVVEKVTKQSPRIASPTLDDIFSADKWARDNACEILCGRGAQ